MRKLSALSVSHAAASFILSNLCGAQTSVGEVKIPRPLPHMADIKTPAPRARMKEIVDEVQLPATKASSPSIAKHSTTSATSGFLAGLDRTHVYFDQPGDGAIWAAGDRYKASFDASGVTYIPFFGSRAPRNFPVHMKIDDIVVGGAAIRFERSAQPVRSANRITFDRGALLEVYDLSPETVEQSFVFKSIPAAGDLVVRLSVESELARSEFDGELVLQGESGSVRYGAAVAFDARGMRDAAPTSWSGDEVEIRVSSQRLIAAQFPLTIDPLISTFPIEVGTEDFIQPDVAFDAATARWSVVYERAFSATDHDVLTQLFTYSGSFISGEFIDVSTDYWANPRVANNSIASQFLCVAQAGDPSSGARVIRGRTIDASSGALGPKFTISDGETGDLIHPDVGGDPSPAPPTYYCVVWERVLTSNDFDIHAQLVRSDSTLLSVSSIFVENSSGTEDGNPSISKSDGAPPAAEQDWNVVWTRTVSLLDNDLYGAQIHWDGTITSPTFAIDTSVADTSAPSVTSPTTASPRKWLVAYSHTPLFGDSEIYGKLYQGTTLLDTKDLTLQSGAPTGESQFAPGADCDGASFIVANTESEPESGPGPSTDYIVYLSTFSAVGNQIGTAEGHVRLTGDGLDGFTQNQVAVATAGSAGGPLRRTFATWHSVFTVGMGTPDPGTIEGALYDADPFTSFCAPGAYGVMTCPCANAPLLPNAGCNNSAAMGGGMLTATGNVSPDSVVLHATNMMPNATCIFLQGNALAGAGATFGDGVRCAGGSLLRLYVKTASGGAASAPAGLLDILLHDRSASLGDTILPGTKRWYQTYYRDPASFACASPATFNITSGVQIDW